MVRRFRFCAGLAVVSLVACGADEPAADTIATVPTSAPAANGGPGGSWVATSATGADGTPVELLEGWDVTVTVDGDQISGTAACNGYGGTASFGDDGHVGVGEVNMTEMGCQSEVQAVEQAFVTALTEFTDYSVDGDNLALSGGGHEWVFERLSPIDDAAVVGTIWVLDTYISDGASTNTPAMENATLTLDADGTLSGSTGCRRLEGEWIETGAEITITNLSAIDDPAAGQCAPDSEQLDNWVISVLEGGVRPTVDGNRLTVMGQGGEGLSYTAQSDE